MSMKKKKIGVFVGSLRQGSFSSSIAECVIGLAPENFEFEIVDISKLPLYNQDFDDKQMPEYEKFRAKVKELDGVLFITPEHNRSIPAALKNALDVGSRPAGKSVWGGKPGAVISQSPGSIGGFGANHHLRQVLVLLNVPMLQQPEGYISNVATTLDDKGKLTAESTVKVLRNFINAYADWVIRITR